MKRVFGVLMLLMVLTGCAGENRELKQAMEFRQMLLAARGCSFDAQITADHGELLDTFSLRCQTDQAGDTAFEVLEPDTIAGIRGTISDTGGEITFDDTALYFALLTEDQFSPVSAPWIFLKALRSGYISAVCREEDYLHITVDDSYAADALMLDVWLREGQVPVRADICRDGRRILSLEIESFAFL